MTSPATFNTPGRLIKMAMQDAGKLKEGVDPSSEALADNMVRLCDMINIWQTQGLKLWLNSDLTVTLAVGQTKYSLSLTGDVVMQPPTRVIQAYYVDSLGSSRPIDPPLSRDEYTRLSKFPQNGAVSSYFVDKQQNSLDVYLWLTPDANAAAGAVHLIIQQQVINPVNLTDSMNFPQEWFAALRWGLADEICTGQPPAIVDRCAKRSATFFKLLEDWDVEDTSTSFQPDTRYSEGRGFR